jgi:hypothetical protein
MFMKIADVDLMNLKAIGRTAVDLLRITVLMQTPALVGYIWPRLGPIGWNFLQHSNKPSTSIRNKNVFITSVTINF